METDEWPGEREEGGKEQEGNGGERWQGAEREEVAPHGDRGRGSQGRLKGREKGGTLRLEEL